MAGRRGGRGRGRLALCSFALLVSYLLFFFLFSSATSQCARAAPPAVKMRNVCFQVSISYATPTHLTSLSIYLSSPAPPSSSPSHVHQRNKTKATKNQTPEIVVLYSFFRLLRISSSYVHTPSPFPFLLLLSRPTTCWHKVCTDKTSSWAHPPTESASEQRKPPYCRNTGTRPSCDSRPPRRLPHRGHHPPLSALASWSC